MLELTANIIFHHNSYGLSQDAKILVKYLDMLSGMHKQFKIKVRPVSTNNYETGYVDINFFLEVPNPLLFHFAKTNILIPNQEWFYTHWTEYLDNIDYIWCKTEYAQQLFSSITEPQKVVHIGWTTIDKFCSELDKKNECIHIAGSSCYKGTSRLLEYWSPDLPQLTIYYNSKTLKLSQKQQDNIHYIDKYLPDNEIKKVINQYRFHICPSECEGFGHYIMDALCCKNIVITTKSPPMNTLVENQFCLNIKETKEIQDIIDKRNLFDPSDLLVKIKSLVNLKKETLTEIGDKNRNRYISQNKVFRNHLKSAFHLVLDKIKSNSFNVKIPCEIQSKINDLPYISIVTITHNRPEFVELMKLNYIGIDYPREKLEWVILDDSDKLLTKNAFKDVTNQ